MKIEIETPQDLIAALYLEMERYEKESLTEHRRLDREYAKGRVAGLSIAITYVTQHIRTLKEMEIAE